MKFISTPDQLTIQLEGMEQLWALRRRLRIARDAVVEVDYLPTQPAMQDFWGYWRIPGTALPGVFLAGSYRKHGEREFWYLKMRTPGVLTVHLAPGATPYDKIRLTCMPETAQQVTDWWQENKRV